MAQEITLRRVSKDEDRAHVRDFFAAHIPDPTALAVPPRQFDSQLGIPSRIRVAENADGELVGAVFASNNPEDVVGWRA